MPRTATPNRPHNKRVVTSPPVLVLLPHNALDPHKALKPEVELLPHRAELPHSAALPHNPVDLPRSHAPT